MFRAPLKSAICVALLQLLSVVGVSAQDESSPVIRWAILNVPAAEETLSAPMGLEVTSNELLPSREFDLAYTLAVTNAGYLCMSILEPSDNPVLVYPKTMENDQGTPEPVAGLQTCDGDTVECDQGELPGSCILDSDSPARLRLDDTNLLYVGGEVSLELDAPEATTEMPVQFTVTDYYPTTSNSACRGGCW